MVVGWWIKSNTRGYRDVMPEENIKVGQVEVLNGTLQGNKRRGLVFYNHKVRYEDGKMIHPFTVAN